MAQAIPSVLFHGQAVKLLDDLRDAYLTGVGTVDELITSLRDILTNFETTVGTPLMDFDPVVEGEPPLSAKINRLWDALMHDINILSQQADISRAATLMTHNMVTTEILNAQQANSRLANKLKTLQLYSKSVDSSIVTFGDHFRSMEFIDTDFSSDELPMFLGESYVVIGQSGDYEELGTNAIISILDSSNGFSGNLHEVSGALRDVTFYQGGPTYKAIAADGEHPFGSYEEIKQEPFQEAVFKAETSTRRSTDAVLDSNPDTWFEYERCWIDQRDRLYANNFGFSYRRPVPESTDENPQYDLVDWASGPPGGVLKLDFEIDIRAVQNVNYITYAPYNLENNSNYPVKVVEVRTSTDRTNWDTVRPRDVVIGPTSNLQTAGAADATVTGAGIWAFANRAMRYIRMSIEQEHGVDANLGHLYYLKDRAVSVPAPTPTASDAVKTIWVQERVEGPLPLASNPSVYYDPAVRRVGEGANQLIQRRETFTGKRWVVGIRDISIQQFNHSLQSVFVTKRLRVGGLVDRITIDSDVTIPPEFPEGTAWVQFYVSPDDGLNWYPISRVQDNYLGIPEIIAFNDPLPVALREPGIGYYNTASPVTMLRLKVALQRPGNLPSTTPILHGYTMRVKRR
jgi:hypothetical protein